MTAFTDSLMYGQSRRLALVAEDHVGDLVEAWRARADVGLRKGLKAFNARLLDERGGKSFELVDGIAIVPITGCLVQQLGALDPWYGMTGYDGITRKVQDAVVDPDVRGIALMVDSGGGEVSGCHACGEVIYRARAAKPIAAVLDECAYSAAYWLASAAHSIAVPVTGGVGSIGVVSIHADFSAVFKEWGINLTVMRSGERKAEGNPYEPLSEACRDDWQAQMDAVRTLFVDTVARNRRHANADAKALMATEGRCIAAITGEAESLCLADAVVSPAEACAAFAAHLAAA